MLVSLRHLVLSQTALGLRCEILVVAFRASPSKDAEHQRSATGAQRYTAKAHFHRSAIAQEIQQAGGARVECDEKGCVAGATARDPILGAIARGAKMLVCSGSGFAHCDVVTARLQSGLQHPALLRITVSFVVPVESVQRCALVRRQQACAGADAASSAIGSNVPRSANSSRSLAVRRCMQCGESEPNDGLRIEQVLATAQGLESHCDKGLLFGGQPPSGKISQKGGPGHGVISFAN